MRHVKGQRHVAKGPEHDAKVDQLATMIADAFAADAEGTEGAPFSGEFFMAGTRLPEPPAGDDTDAEDDDEVGIIA